MDKEQLSQFIKEKAKELGFQDCGIAQATFLSEEAPRLEKWLSEERMGQMHYLNNHFDKRLDPRLLVEGAKSVISLSYNYYPSELQIENSYSIAKYAYGEDYHFVIKDHLKKLLEAITDEIGEINARIFTDSAPVLEKAWAVRSGLGWVGKNGNLITKQKGSYFLLAEIILDIELEYDIPYTNSHCGSCTKCIDACPTQAIYTPHQVDGSRCISYFTIELKDEIPEGNNFQDWIFGCDICQDVCPWNRFAKPHHEERFKPDDRLLQYSKSEWKELTEEIFQEIFRKSAVKRTKYSGLMRNIDYVSNERKDAK